MSYTNETTHFGIPLPLGSDLTTPMDYNEAFEAVDGALFGAQGDAATANENATGAVETANATAEALDTLSATVGGHTSQISALGARMTNAENNIDDVRSDLEDMIIAFNEPTATSTHNYTIGDYFIYNDVLYKATAAIAIGDAIVPNRNCSATNVMTEVSAGGGSTPTATDISLAPIIGMTADDVQEGIEELHTGLADKVDKTDFDTDTTTVTAKPNYTISNVFVKKVGGLHFVSFRFSGTIPATSGGATIASLGVNLPHANTTAAAYVWDSNGYVLTTGCCVSTTGDIIVIAGAAGVSGAVQILYY